MSKIAVILSGQVRTFEQTHESLFTNLLNNEPCDFFMHTWDTTGKVLQVHRSYDFTTKTDEELIKKIYDPKRFVIENAEEFQKRIDIGRFCGRTPEGGTSTMSIVSQWYSLNRALRLLNDYMFETGTKYDLVLRCRFDSRYDSKLDIPNNVSQYNTVGEVFIPNNPQYGLRDCYCCNDTFGMGNIEAMRVYCDLYNNLDRIMDHPENLPFHPETMLAWNLNSRGILRRPINFDYTLIR